MSKPNPIPIANNVYYSLVSMIINIYLWYKNIFWIPTAVFYSQFFSQSEAVSAAIFSIKTKLEMEKNKFANAICYRKLFPIWTRSSMFIISNGKKIPAKNLFAISNIINEKKNSSGKKNCLPRENMRGSLTGSKTGFMTWNFCCCCCNVTGGVRLLNLRLIHTQLIFYRISTFSDFIILDPYCFVILFQASTLWIPRHLHGRGAARGGAGGAAAPPRFWQIRRRRRAAAARRITTCPPGFLTLGASLHRCH